MSGLLLKCGEGLRWSHKLEIKVSEGVGWSQLLDGLSFERWLVLFVCYNRDLAVCKSDLMKELNEVNCWLLYHLKCWLVLSCVTIANWFISEVISWKSESVRGAVWRQLLSGLFFEMWGGASLRPWIGSRSSWGSWLKSTAGWFVFWSVTDVCCYNRDVACVGRS